MNLQKINGYKTYFVGTAGILFGITGLILGNHDANAALQFIITGLSAMAIRHGISKN